MATQAGKQTPTFNPYEAANKAAANKLAAQNAAVNNAVANTNKINSLIDQNATLLRTNILYKNIADYLLPLANPSNTNWGSNPDYNWYAVLPKTKFYFPSITGMVSGGFDGSRFAPVAQQSLNDFDKENIGTVFSYLQAQIKNNETKIATNTTTIEGLRKAVNLITPSNTTGTTQQKPPTKATGDASAFKGANLKENTHRFNLPPHQWSLPIRPSTVNQEMVGINAFEDADFHATRRGIIYFWGDSTSINVNSTTSSGNSGSSVQGTTASTNQSYSSIDRNYGFQFLWNPESISTSVAMNLDVTPSAADRLRATTGFFPAQEQLSLSIVLDRTNDFACIMAGGKGNQTPSFYLDYYKHGYPDQKNDITQDQKIEDLMNLGTMADLEYLYKAINGSGAGSSPDKNVWTNPLGKKTADIGYLAPMLLAFQLGAPPYALSYVGYINNIAVSHTAFTETMIPIRTNVDLSINCFTGSGITSS